MELGQGDIMVMDIRLLHHGTANQAEDPRTLLYVQYVQDFFIDRGNCVQISTAPPALRGRRPI